MVSSFPFWINNWPFANFYDAITRRQARFPCGVNELNVGPLVPVVMNVIRNLAEQDTFGLQHPVSFLNEGRECVRKRVVVFFG